MLEAQQEAAQAGARIADGLAGFPISLANAMRHLGTLAAAYAEGVTQEPHERLALIASFFEAARDRYMELT